MADQDLAQAIADWDAVSKEREQENSSPGDSSPDLETKNSPLEDSLPVAKAEAQKQVDPYEGLHPDVRSRLERFDLMASSQQQLVTELKEAKGRIGALQSEFAKARQAQSAEQPTQRQIAAAQADPQKWAALKSDFPEWGEGISEYVESRLGQLRGVGLTPEQVEQLVAQRTEATTSALEKRFNEALVSVKHKNWRQDVNTPEFTAWFHAQPGDVQALASSPHGFDAIEMLDRFSADKAKPATDVKQERQQKLQAAVTGKPGGGKVTKTFEDMTPKEQWEYMARERERSAA